MAAIGVMGAVSVPCASTKAAAATSLNAGCGSRVHFTGSGRRGMGSKSHNRDNKLPVHVFGDVSFVSSVRAVANAARGSRGRRLVVGARVADCIGWVPARGRALILVS